MRYRVTLTCFVPEFADAAKIIELVERLGHVGDVGVDMLHDITPDEDQPRLTAPVGEVADDHGEIGQVRFEDDGSSEGAGRREDIEPAPRTKEPYGAGLGRKTKLMASRERLKEVADHADRHGVDAAAKHFGLQHKTVQAYQSEWQRYGGPH